MQTAHDIFQNRAAAIRLKRRLPK